MAAAWFDKTAILAPGAITDPAFITHALSSANQSVSCRRAQRLHIFFSTFLLFSYTPFLSAPCLPCVMLHLNIPSPPLPPSELHSTKSVRFTVRSICRLLPKLSVFKLWEVCRCDGAIQSDCFHTTNRVRLLLLLRHRAKKVRAFRCCSEIFADVSYKWSLSCLFLHKE